ncbi:hypothetical protein M6B22_03440 [Jatrophihabitans cynanchi]|uniref:AbrB/MazE/SpoVT family DNA-binding domain-containing protein n=1 Tax=Jatrophihabitans cynanchi TaxID=2944128 RepID=A0ABY7K2P6_9ACTN|nr:hypothetical protein [Jatrophihabitans sp. SB3-54]WAX57827.1 hypothetical protein M6B22_03440 [Jatrophihabitans sp. SB3-54]
MAKRPVPQVEVRLTQQGTISWPAALRNRWQAKYLLVEDHGDYAIVRPMATDDPLAITRQRPMRDR